MFKNLQKTLKAHHFLALLGLVVLAYVVMQYSGRKGMMSDGFTDVPLNRPADIQMGGSQPALPAEPAGQNEVYSSVTGINTSSYGLPPSCSKGNMVASFIFKTICRMYGKVLKLLTKPKIDGIEQMRA